MDNEDKVNGLEGFLAARKEEDEVIPEDEAEANFQWFLEELRKGRLG